MLTYFWKYRFKDRAIISITKSLETIPIVLADNAGMDPIDTQVRLRAKIASINKNGKAKYGVDVLEAKIADLSAKDIY